MLTGHARARQQADPRRLRPTLRGVPKWSVVYDHNPRLARPDEQGDFAELPGRDGTNNRPYHTAKTPQRWYYNLAFRPERGELYLTPAERAFARAYAGRILVEPGLKPGASPNKQWGLRRWQQLANLLIAVGWRPAQFHMPGVAALRGVEVIRTSGFRQACAVLEVARGAVLPEGGLHHAAAALGVPAVVIFGGYIPVELTGYTHERHGVAHRNLGVSLDEACGWRIPCAHCAAQMDNIAPERACTELEDLLEENRRRLAP